jgi:hypothetical protein
VTPRGPPTTATTGRTSQIRAPDDARGLDHTLLGGAEESRFEFMVVGPPLRLPGATGSPWNPIAIF